MSDKPTQDAAPSPQSKAAQLNPPQLTRQEVEATLKGAIKGANEVDLKLRAVFELSDDKASLRLG